MIQDVFEDTEGKLGPIVSGELFYALTDRVSLGLNVEWEKHKINDIPSGFLYGHSTTLSVIPFVEVRSHGFMRNSPYVSLGLGANFNTFEESDSFQTICLISLLRTCKSDLDNTFALRAGLGTDYFVTEVLALNVEFGWKYNSGKIHGDIDDDFRAIVLTILFGIRSYWP